MKVGVVGGGAVGLLIASYLSEKHIVTIYTRTEEQSKEINRNGLRLEVDGKVINREVHAEIFPPQHIGQNDLVIIAVKQYQLQTIIPTLINAHTNLLFVQNGMGHVQYFNQLSKNNQIFVGVVEHGALKDHSNSVIHTGKGVIKVASYSENSSLDLSLVQVDELFPVLYEKDYKAMLTNKLVVNAMINPLTAVLEVTNGEVLINESCLTLFEELLEEVTNILSIENKEEMKEHVKQVCKKTAKNRSSMLCDLAEGRMTEVDAILGYLLTVAENEKIAAPIMRTLYLLVKGKEAKV